MGIHIRGKFPNYVKAAAKATTRAELATVDAAFEARDEARRNAPVRSGHLRDSITADVNGLKAEIGPTEWYGALVENGTARVAPQPYLIPAAEKAELKYRAALEKAVEQSME